jgi:hypothetical protein
MEDSKLAATFGIAFGLATAVWSTWCAVISFTGGKLPLLPWTMEGGIVSGLLFLFFAEPLLITVAYWAGMLVALPLAGLVALSKRGA